jgi:two-component system cell cycle sensor histidine kinase/response regulator CckA
MVKVESQVRTIFVVDDDADAAELLAQALSRPGLRVRAFSDPIRALAAISAEGADILVADLAMPWIDGKDVLAAARLRRPSLFILMVSGMPEGAEIAAREGVRFFAKPVNLDQLRMAVDEALAARGAGQAWPERG